MTPQLISPEPIHGFIRKVELAGINIPIKPFLGDAVSLTLAVTYFDTNENPIEIIPPKIVTLNATRDTLVNAQGEIVEEDWVMSEFDFFIALMDQPVVISEIVQAKIKWADSLHKFD